MTAKRGVYKARKRKRKHDTLLNPQATRLEIETDLAVAAFDRKAREIDRHWGVDRLVELVDAETAHKYAQALGRLNDAIAAQDPALTARRVNDCIKGMDYMHSLAIAANAAAASDAYWELEVEGMKAAIVADMDAWPTIKKQRPDLELISLREVGHIWQWYRDTRAGEMTSAIKASFPKAEVVSVYKQHNDEIPF